jgi:hypothetical protein
LQIKYANWSFYDRKDGAKVLQRQTPSFVGSIGLKKSQPQYTAVTSFPAQGWQQGMNHHVNPGEWA